MNPKFNEWQEMSLKKDVESIRKNIDNRQEDILLLVFDVFLAILTVILSQVLSDASSICKIIIYSIIGGLSFLTLVYLIYKWIRNWWKKYNSIKHSKISVKSYVDDFDNSICYYAMTAYSFYECYMTADNTEIKKFYFIEAFYYIDKALNQLSSMESMVTNIFTANDLQVVKDSKIHISRLENLVAMMKTVREGILAIEQPNPASKGILDIAKKYDRRFSKFIKKYNQLMNQNLEWLNTEQKQ